MDTEPTTPTVLLSATLDTLRKAMEPESPCRIPADDALFFLWWCIDQQENLSADLAVLDENILYPLIEILSSLSAFSPDSQTRFLAFRLVATLVREHTGTSVAGQTLQFTLVKDLLSGSATPAFRTACIEIAKDVLIDQLERSEREPEYESIFLSARCMKELGPIVLAFDPPTLFEQEEVSPEQFVEDSQSDVLQKLNWYYFMLERDRDNKTGIRSTQLMQQANETFLTPLRSKLRSLGSSLSFLELRWLDQQTKRWD
ncbi:uncharacterized protein JCM15063_003026 [Sporobolomyces koalae]|uniref:uncharacterized protein n=1 Tax=Sporobolomyces koalae TaxID=500713 RepID=UPI00317F5069